MDAGELLDKLEAIDLLDIAIRIIKKTKHRLLTRMKQRLRKGVDADGVLLPPYKSASWANWKHKYGSKAPYGTPDYLYSKALYDSLDLVFEGNDFYVDSDVDYFEFLEGRGGTPFEFAEEDFDWYVEEVFYPAFYAELEKKGLSLF